MKRFALSLLLLLASPAFAQITLAPSAPRVHDMVEILLNGAVIGDEWRTAPGPDVTMAGGKITVTLQLTGNAGIPANLDWALGALPAGSYQVEVVKRTAAGTVTPVAQTSFTVAARTGNAPRTDYSDLYFNPNESGWGLNIQQHPSDKIFATWFVYGLDNKPTWYVIPDGAWTDDHTYTGKVYRTRGSYYNDAVWNPSLLTVIEVGTATLTFTKYNAVILTYVIDGTGGQKSAVRQGF